MGPEAYIIQEPLFKENIFKIENEILGLEGMCKRGALKLNL